MLLNSKSCGEIQLRIMSKISVVAVKLLCSTGSKVEWKSPVQVLGECRRDGCRKWFVCITKKVLIVVGKVGPKEVCVIM